MTVNKIKMLKIINYLSSNAEIKYILFITCALNKSAMMHLCPDIKIDVPG